MIYIKTDGNIVTNLHYMPFDSINGLGKTREELESEGGIFIEALPEPENHLGKSATLKYSSEGGLYYEYINRPLTPEEQIESLKAENQALNTAVVELYEIVLGGI